MDNDMMEVLNQLLANTKVISDNQAVLHEDLIEINRNIQAITNGMGLYGLKEVCDILERLDMTLQNVDSNLFSIDLKV